MSAATASKISSMLEAVEFARSYFHMKHKLGAIWYNPSTQPLEENRSKTEITVGILPSDPKTVRKVLRDFNKVQQVTTYRTHGRTTSLERFQMGYFAQFICPKIIAKKFAVSLPTVYLYAKKIEKMV